MTDSTHWDGCGSVHPDCIGNRAPKDDPLARALAAAFCGSTVDGPLADDEFTEFREKWLRVAAMARVVIAMEKP